LIVRTGVNDGVSKVEGRLQVHQFLETIWFISDLLTIISMQLWRSSKFLEEYPWQM